MATPSPAGEGVVEWLNENENGCRMVLGRGARDFEYARWSAEPATSRMGASEREEDHGSK